MLDSPNSLLIESVCEAGTSGPVTAPPRSQGLRPLGHGAAPQKIAALLSPPPPPPKKKRKKELSSDLILMALTKNKHTHTKKLGGVG